MASRAYPITYSFLDQTSRKRGRITHCAIIETSLSRKKEWVIRSKSHWDDEFTTVVNCDQHFKEFFAASIYETREFIVGGSANGTVRTHPRHREQMGGKLGYERGTFFWNLMGWAFVSAHANMLIHTLEDAAEERHIDALKALPEPHAIAGKERDRLSDGGIAQEYREEFEWSTAGLEYQFDYYSEMVRILKPIGFRIDFRW